ncbi:MAG: DUF2752 domain-containing protein [Lentimicrobium sp.]|jgi:hypothetical protein|nr:DUF2752 domain-containing protein [Lentimicrobium sp.]MDD2526715.1 DUF2752 domain-containing protein [Lentimicrobiaceae bacterium]MDY0024681.1 DUF2752 domain-containing protein [Lentimicrobium sp.]
MAEKFGHFLRFRWEAVIWIAALILFATMSPYNEHASLCPINALDLGFCPGCGLGHGIAFLFRGEFIASFKAHPLAMPAVVILTLRIIHILRTPLPVNHF